MLGHEARTDHSRSLARKLRGQETAWPGSCLARKLPGLIPSMFACRQTVFMARDIRLTSYRLLGCHRAILFPSLGYYYCK